MVCGLIRWSIYARMLRTLRGTRRWRVRGSWYAIQEGPQTQGELGQSVPVWPVGIVRALANFSLYTIAHLFAIAVVFPLFHVFDDII